MRQADLSLSLLELARRCEFQVVDDTDHLTSVTGLDITTLNVRYPTLSSWATISAAETGFGWYRPAITTAAQTVGSILFHLAADTGYDPVDFGVSVNEDPVLSATQVTQLANAAKFSEATYFRTVHDNLISCRYVALGGGDIADRITSTVKFTPGTRMDVHLIAFVPGNDQTFGFGWGYDPDAAIAVIDEDGVVTASGDANTTYQDVYLMFRFSLGVGQTAAVAVGGTITLHGFDTEETTGVGHDIVLKVDAGTYWRHVFPLSRHGSGYATWKGTPYYGPVQYMRTPSFGVNVTDDDAPTVNPMTFTVLDQLSAPLIGAKMAVSDAATGTVFLAAFATDPSGVGIVYGLAAGNYKVVGSLAGYNIPATEITVPDGGGSVTINAVKHVITGPVSPDLCTLYGYVADIGLIAQAGIPVSVAPSGTVDVDVGGKQLNFKPVTATTDGTGLWSVDVPTEISISVKCPAAKFDKTVTIADGTATLDWIDI